MGGPLPTGRQVEGWLGKAAGKPARGVDGVKLPSLLSYSYSCMLGKRQKTEKGGQGDFGEEAAV